MLSYVNITQLFFFLNIPVSYDTLNFNCFNLSKSIDHVCKPNNAKQSGG